MKPKRRHLARLGDVLGRDRVRYLADELSPRELRRIVDQHELAASREERRLRLVEEVESAGRGSVW